MCNFYQHKGRFSSWYIVSLKHARISIVLVRNEITQNTGHIWIIAWTLQPLLVTLHTTWRNYPIVNLFILIHLMNSYHLLENCLETFLKITAITIISACWADVWLECNICCVSLVFRLPPVEIKCLGVTEVPDFNRAVQTPFSTGLPNPAGSGLVPPYSAGKVHDKKLQAPYVSPEAFQSELLSVSLCSANGGTQLLHRPPKCPIHLDVGCVLKDSIGLTLEKERKNCTCTKVLDFLIS